MKYSHNNRPFRALLAALALGMTFVGFSTLHAADPVDAFIADVNKAPAAKPAGKAAAGQVSVAAAAPAAPPKAADSVSNLDNFDWMAVGAQEQSIVVGLHDGRPDLAKVTGTTLPKPTSNLANFTKVYELELEKFGIKNDGTDAEATSKGINAALKHAKTLDINRIVFPAGTYLISPSDPIIIDHKNTVIDLNKSVLQMQTNNLLRYTVVEIVKGAENLRLTNGHIKGDRDTHDYKTNKGAHEHGMALTMSGGDNMEIDNLTLSDVSGSGLSTRIVAGRGGTNYFWIGEKDIKQGRISDAGAEEPSTEKLITKYFDISKIQGKFEFGYTLGYMGYASVRRRVYQVYFYDAEQKFISKIQALQYKKITPPEGAKFARFEFNQAVIKNGSEGAVGRVTDLPSPTNVHFHSNKLFNNRTLGMAFCGGQYWIIENNMFEGNGGNAPGFGVDFEDGWDMMTDIIFRKNNFKNNKAGDLVVCAGTEMIFEDNTFEKSAIFYDRVNNYLVQKNTFNGAVLYRTGIKHAEVRNNTYKNGRLEVQWNLNKWGGVPPLALENETLKDMTSVTGGYLVFDGGKFTNTTIKTTRASVLVQFKNAEMTDTTVVYDPASAAAATIIEGSTIKLTKDPLISAVPSKAVLLKLEGNTISSESDKPLIDLPAIPAVKVAGKTAPESPEANSRIVLESNKITLAKSAWVIAGVPPAKGQVEVINKDNQTSQQMLSPALKSSTTVKVSQ